MPNPVVPALKDWLLRHEGDVAHGINDYGDLAPVFEHLWGRPASPAKKAETLAISRGSAAFPERGIPGQADAPPETKVE